MLSSLERMELELLNQTVAYTLEDVRKVQRLREKASAQQEIELFGYRTKEMVKVKPVTGCLMSHYSELCFICGNGYGEHLGHTCLGTHDLGIFPSCRPPRCRHSDDEECINCGVPWSGHHEHICPPSSSRRPGARGRFLECQP